MDGLQRSTTSFRRQGSSGLVWDDKFLRELNNQAIKQKEEQEQLELQQQQQQEQGQGLQGQDQIQEINKPEDVIKPSITVNTIERSRSGRGYRTGKVSPAIEPPSPRVSACGFCSPFGTKPPMKKNHHKRKSAATAGKRRSR